MKDIWICNRILGISSSTNKQRENGQEMIYQWWSHKVASSWMVIQSYRHSSCHYNRTPLFSTGHWVSCLNTLNCIGDILIFMKNNTPPDTGYIHQMYWPVRFPNLNPFKNRWSHFGKANCSPQSTVREKFYLRTKEKVEKTLLISFKILDRDN